MSTKKIALYTALFALAAGMLFTCYRGVQLYHEVARPPVLVANAAAPAVQPGKQVTTYTFSVVREVVVPSAPVAVPRRAPRRHK
ncbi:hypothetical protein FNT36_24080 [Hymenobacter setariae]|uniref:Uncharacterized protein n=1 Tax=Hymenobacter setariae TaxID=2594794 RepID=A0A558BKA1_9BACT|nr:hypothetical protein [Hymenobacter setariae]TVT36950.1 hypothetical protein FNT36_24080 [Hymenobacter setariae]